MGRRDLLNRRFQTAESFVGGEAGDRRGRGGAGRREEEREDAQLTAEASACAWAADGWTNNGVYAPEVAQLRDVAFLTKMMIADPYALRESVASADGASRERAMVEARIRQLEAELAGSAVESDELEKRYLVKRKALELVDLRRVLKRSTESGWGRKLGA